MPETTQKPSILLTPGPTAVPPQVLQEMAQPIIHHRTKQFQAIFSELCEALQQILLTKGPVLSIAGSGTTSYEATQLCLSKPGSKVLTVAGGKFGERWQDVFDAYSKYLNIEQIKINVPWGQAVDVAQVEQALKDNPDISVVTLVHSETSTATASDVKAVAAITQKTDALLIVDGITAVGAFECRMDDWGIDCLVTGSQKALMLPPGLGYVGLGERALKRLDAIETLPGYNLDLRKWLKSVKKNDVPFTPPVSLIRGQLVACKMILDEGLENVWQRTGKLAHASREAFKALGLQLCSQSPSDSVTGAYYPQGVDDKIRGTLRDEFGVNMAGGQDGRGDKWAGKVFRISHMGYVNADETRIALDAIEKAFRNAGALQDVPAGTAVRVFDEQR